MKALKVTTARPSRRRAGFDFSNAGPVHVPLKGLKKEHEELIKNDPMLNVQEVELADELPTKVDEMKAWLEERDVEIPADAKAADLKALVKETAEKEAAGS